MIKRLTLAMSVTGAALALSAGITSAAPMPAPVTAQPAVAPQAPAPAPGGGEMAEPPFNPLTPALGLLTPVTDLLPMPMPPS
ncbi:hypothetical protein J1792_15810 [Streptomyces triculaminicus]|uniref:Uncharacterized protein n=2 Tax=Streptomyces TaxID=1883 RepID=A0A939FNX8_9ACTN|nr:MULTISPECIES: hypothetical protein [Streptomyces]MBO0654184.1 hypothetical protein [Streptomyces triculaminicus]QSY48859.1 hypothetical protein J3S04_28190 [Streptomyces griseocarneus]